MLDIVERDQVLAESDGLHWFVNGHLPFVNTMSLGQVLALRKQAGELTDEEREGYKHLLLCTVAGVSAGVQNTG